MLTTVKLDLTVLLLDMILLLWGLFLSEESYYYNNYTQTSTCLWHNKLFSLIG
jgi:hypothetical protein